MNSIRLLVQNQRETDSVMLREEIGSPYAMGYVRGQIVPPANYVRQNWFGEGFGDPWSATLFGGESTSALIKFLESELDVSEIDFGPLETFTADIEGTYMIAGYSADYLGSEVIDLEVEAAKLSRDIAKTKIERIIGLLGRDYLYHLLGDTLRIVKRSPTKPEWALEIEKLGPKRPSTQELAGLIRSLKSVLNAGDFWQIDTAFRTLNVSSISVEGLIGLLRTTYYRRSSLETWTAFLDSVRKELSKRGLNAQEVIFGLL
jgi:hypothetical protein